MHGDIVALVVHTFFTYACAQACGLLSAHAWARMARTACRFYDDMRCHIVGFLWGKAQVHEHAWHVLLKGLGIGVTLLRLCGEVVFGDGAAALESVVPYIVWTQVATQTLTDDLRHLLHFV